MEKVFNLLERLVEALEQQNELREEYNGTMSNLVDYYMGATSYVAEEAVSEPEPEKEVEDKPDYAEMRAFLAERGVEVKKGSKYNTVLKLYEAEKIKIANKQLEDGYEQEFVEATKEETIEPEVVETPTEDLCPPVHLADDLLETTPAEEPKKEPMTREELKEKIMANYDQSPADQAKVTEAFQAAGKTRLFEFEGNGDCDVAWAKYAKLKGIA